VPLWGVLCTGRRLGFIGVHPVRLAARYRGETYRMVSASSFTDLLELAQAVIRDAATEGAPACLRRLPAVS
jgi:hypothetical protein